MELSAIIITKNEENNIEALVKNLQFADEIIVIDNDSKDKTVEKAINSGARVYSKKFNDFAQQRNLGLKEARGKWLLYIDADERLTPELITEILSVLKNPSSKAVAFKIPRKNFYFGQYEWPKIEMPERLFQKDYLKEWYGELHESPRINGEVVELKNYLLHYTHKNLDKMLQKTNEWSEIEAKLLYQAKHPRMVGWRFLRIMLTKFYDSFIKQGGWRIGTVGLIESLYQAFSYFIVYAKLWEKQSKN